MNPKFQASVAQREDVTYVKLAGVIDEDNELNTLADKLGSGTAVIDVSEIERINSCGVRDWVNWLGKAEKGGAKVVLVECSPAIVAQINLVNNFTGNGLVKSFYAPYFCPNCDLEKVLLVETRDMAGTQPFKAPSCRCDECDGPMDFDDMEESYFAFLANTKKIVTDARVDSVINEFTPTDGDRKIRPRSSGGTNPGSKSGGSSAGGSSAGGSLPSIPSLPNIKQTVGGTGTGPGLSSVSGINGFGGGSSASGVRSSAAAALAELEARRAQTAPVPKEPGKANALWYAVVAILVVAVGVLGFVLFGGKH